jgi:hypothetical protein
MKVLLGIILVLLIGCTGATLIHPERWKRANVMMSASSINNLPLTLLAIAISFVFILFFEPIVAGNIEETLDKQLTTAQGPALLGLILVKAIFTNPVLMVASLLSWAVVSYVAVKKAGFN